MSTHELVRAVRRDEGVGTCAWAAAGGPALSAKQKLGMLAGVVVDFLLETPPNLLWSLAQQGLLRARYPSAVTLPALPDTAVVKAAAEALREYGQDHNDMVEHSFRCYYFAEALYQLDGSRAPLDHEALAVAMLLHDVGLFTPAVKALPYKEFTVRSAAVARQIAEEAGWPAERLDLLTQHHV